MCVFTHSAPTAQPRPTQPCPAKALNPNQRQTLAVQALARTAPITQLAAELDVSRKFVYQQQTIATEFALATVRFWR